MSPSLRESIRRQTDAQLRQLIADHGDDQISRFASGLLAERREEAKAESLSSIDRRLAALEKRSEWKTWALRIALLALVIALLALARDYFGWSSS